MSKYPLSDEKKILVIDDDDDFRVMLRIMLKRSGFQVLEAQNGKVGIHLYKESNPDLVITDLFMPEQEGLETIRELKSMDSESKIIAISGGYAALALDFLPYAETIGACRILSKPFSRNVLLREIKDLLVPSSA